MAHSWGRNYFVMYVGVRYFKYFNYEGVLMALFVYNDFMQ